MNLYCWWFGCEPNVHTPPADTACVRCGGYVEYADMVGDTRHGRLMDRLHTVQCFFAKCPDCGQRFNRHDETVDHVPF